jgi:hypothetical protein
MYTYVNTYVYTYIRTHTYTHTHTYIRYYGKQERNLLKDPFGMCALNPDPESTPYVQKRISSIRPSGSDSDKSVLQYFYDTR